MSGKIYSRFATEGLILRDYLAMDRTVLGNERTLLAYVRTALAFFVAGASLIHFFDPFVFQIVGWMLIPLGILLSVVGIIRYKEMHDFLGVIRRWSHLEQESDMPPLQPPLT